MSNMALNSLKSNQSSIRFGNKLISAHSSRFFFYTLVGSALAATIYSLYGNISNESIISILLLGSAVTLGVISELFE